MFNVECKKCNNYFHQTNECRLTAKIVYFVTQDKKIWKGKHMEDTKCKVALYAKKKKCQWYIDSGCSKHMAGDKSKFLKLTKKEKGIVIFGDNVSAKILGKGIVTLETRKTKQKMCY